MKIGIIGTGAVGQALALGFKKHGHQVMIGSRDPQKLESWVEQKGEGIRLGTFDECARFGKLVILAVKGSAALEAVKLAGEANLSGKAVIDTTNPIDGSRPPVNGVLHFTTSLESSLMEQLQSTYPSVNFVKAFNIVGSAHMVDPSFESKPTMFICGNNDNAKAEVNDLLEQIGWEPMDMGKVESARAIEPLCMLWCIPGFLRNEWNQAFKMLRK